MAKEGEGFKLPQKSVLVKPILREGGWLPKGHSGNFMYDNTHIDIVVPLDELTGELKKVLSDEEERFVEKYMNMEPGALSIYRKKDNFWKNYIVRIQKSEDIVDDDTTLMNLELSDLKQWLDYKVLLANTSKGGGRVAPSWDNRFASGTYKIVLVESDQQNTDKVISSQKRIQAYKYFDSIVNSKDKMYNALAVYWLESPSASQPPMSASQDFYQGEIEAILEKDMDGFLKSVVSAAEDGTLETKILVNKAIGLKVISYNRSSGFETAEGKPLGMSLAQVVKYLSNAKNQQDLIKITNQIELAEE